MNTDTITTPEELKAAVARGELHERHSSKKQGYVSRKSNGKVHPYNGRFGQGYVWDTPRFDSTRYVTRTYFIKAL